MPITESKANKNMEKNIIKINENTLRKIVAESVKRVLNESWSSNVLRQLCRKHGNILVNNVPRGVLTSLQQMSDEEITNAYRMAHNWQNANAASIPFEDGFELQLAISNDNVKAQERTLKNWGYGQQKQIQNGNTGYNTHHKRNNPNTPY